MPRGRPSRASAAPSQAGANSSEGRIPTYQPPLAPLNAKAHSALCSRPEPGSAGDALATGIEHAQRLLSEIAADVAEQGYRREQQQVRRRERLQKLEAGIAAMEQELGDRKDPHGELAARREQATRMRAEQETGQVTAAAMVGRMREAVARTERATRDLVDVRARLEDRAAALREVSGNAGLGTQSSAAPTQATQTETAAGVLQTVKEKMTQKAEDYAAMSMYQRYGANNDYVHFRRAVHDSQYPDEEAPPVPRAAAWFDEDAQMARLLHAPSGLLGPAEPAASQATSAQPPAPDSEDDVQAVAERISINCPLTLQPMKDPVTSTRCPHSFEREAIEEMIDSNGVAPRAGRAGRTGPALGPKELRCPVCPQMLTKDRLRPDPILAKRIERILEQRRRNERGPDPDDDDDDEDVGHRRKRKSVHAITSSSPAPHPSWSMPVKSERPGGRRDVGRRIDADGDDMMEL